MRLLIQLLIPAALALSAAARTPALPQVSDSEGVAMIALARKAMQSYLLYRQDADSQQVPAGARPLDKKSYSVHLTLRGSGQIVGAARGEGQSLARNVITAALSAMRSPKLPNRVNQAVLDSLTVEIEVLGLPEVVSQVQLRGAIVAGLTGLRGSRGKADAVVLPSTAYLKCLSAEQMQRNCLQALPLADVEQAVQWEVFQTAHFVGSPDGRAVRLFRGKTLVPAEAVDSQSIAQTAERVGGYLVRHQDPQGRFEPSPGDKCPQFQQLYAAYALARLAERTGREDFRKAAAAAVDRAAKAARLEGAKAFVEDQTPNETLAATAMLVLAARELGLEHRPPALTAKLLAAMTEYLSQHAEPPAPGSSERPMPGHYIAFAALTRAVHGDRPLPEKLQGLSRSASLSVPQDAEGYLWKAWAGISPPAASRPGILTDLPFKLMPAGEGSEPDEQGGWAVGAAAPTTLVTALQAVHIADSLPAVAKLGDAANVRALRALLADARRFCCQMTYRPHEAYFAADPQAWVGGVRAGPACAEVTVEACAAAIEAFLAEDAAPR